MSKTQTSKTKLISVRLDNHLLQRLIILAKSKEKTLSWLINHGLEYAVNVLERGVEP